MSNKNAIKDNNQYDSVDIVKFVFSILVIGIHTSPFSFNIWLDRGFGIVTRLCVPFFFTTSAFFLFKNGGVQKIYKKNIFLVFHLVICLSPIFHSRIYSTRTKFDRNNFTVERQ